MKASLYVRVKMPDGRYFTTRPAYTANGRIRPQMAMIKGIAERHDTAMYLLRYVRDGKATWETVGKNCNVALAALERKNHALQGKKLGLVPTALPVVAEIEAEAPVLQPAEPVSCARRLLSTAKKQYLSEIQLTKKPKTYAAYTTALNYFEEACKKRKKVYLEDIDRLDMLNFHAYLRDTKRQSPRSCWNKFSNAMTFLKAQEIRKIVRPGDWPTYVEEEPEVYEQEELETFFAVCTAEERIWFQFFLQTGMREQEVMHCAWKNLNVKQGTVSVSWKAEFNWTPKAYKEREIPIPAALLDALKSIRPTDQRGLIFPTSDGKPKGDFLKCCKAIAKRAGLDPDNWWLHKFRATFATWHLQSGVDLRTVQHWMGHVDLESTFRYLKPARGAAVQEKVNKTFAAMWNAA